jgi:translation initiation factor IF-3
LQDKERINEEISCSEVRLILDDGGQRGVVSIKEALALAAESGLDLVEVSASATPPVCRIMDYSKYKFEKNKKDREARKKQRQNQIETKEIKFRPKIEDHDYQTKLKHIRRFLEEGDKVKLVIRFRGREMMFQDSGTELLKRVTEDVTGLGVVEKTPEMQGRQQVMIISPVNN